MGMAVKMQWSLYAAVVLFLVNATHCHRSLQELSCVTDFVRNLSCTWSGSPFDPGVNCFISSVRTFNPDPLIRSCNIEKGTSPPGCSIYFDKKAFNMFESTNITLKCNDTLVMKITNYCPKDHIKMHPPGIPNVTCSTNETLITWDPGSPRSKYLDTLIFQVQIKKDQQTWKEAHDFYPDRQELRLYSRLQGPHQVRVRVKPNIEYKPHWSDWSQITDTTPASEDQEQSQDQILLVTVLVVIISGIIIVLLAVYGYCKKRIDLKGKEIPNPSKYFGSVHEGNIKEWLNPLADPESFFRIQPCDHISEVEVCENWDVVPSTLPPSSSTMALLHFRGYPMDGSDTSGVVDNSSSSSCFSNMGYFMSTYTGSSTQTNPSPTYFTYEDDFVRSHHSHSHSLHLSLCPSISTSSKYESLKMEPQSTDSGFGMDKEDEDTDMDEENEEVSEKDQESPLFILPLVSLSPPSPPPPPAGLTQVSSVNQQAPVGAGTAGAGAAAAGDYAAWPVAMFRSSSMPVEPCKTGYLTLKELHTTFSNNSI